jgi:NOL1/NOP2/fmu family ribosome biogenesis protein
MSIHKNEKIKSYESDYDEAICFMKKENFKIECDTGWNLITYQYFGLGWIKQLGNRFNNYLPNEFRILR